MDVDVLRCDHAQVASKLFISEANIDRFLFPSGTPAAVPAELRPRGRRPRAVDGHPPQLSDGSGGSRTPAEAVGGAIQFNIGRPPTLGSGQEQLVPFAFNFQALPVRRRRPLHRQAHAGR